MMHRNGVKVLGTFLIEPQTPQIERMFDRRDGEFLIAEQLATMADAYGFDGWLLNIEGEFPNAVKDVSNEVVDFIRCLKTKLGPAATVIWYDALTSANEVDHQNGLTSTNVSYALAAGNLFTNYKWTESKVTQAEGNAIIHSMDRESIFFGVDVWAQNSNMPGRKRVTYPPEGGGGTNTGVALEALAERHFSTAIFAPGWTHEHFPLSSSMTLSKAASVEKAMWEGWPLPDDLGCDCKDKPHHTNLYQANAITKYAHEFPAGSSVYFQTDFQQAFGLHEVRDDSGTGPFSDLKGIQRGTKVRSLLGYQGILPHLLPTEVSQGSDPSSPILYGELVDDLCPGIALKYKWLGYNRATNSEDIECFQIQRRQTYRLCLFKLNMLANGSLEVQVNFSTAGMRCPDNFGLYTAIKEPSSDILQYQYVGMKLCMPNPEVSRFTVHCAEPHARLVEFGCYVDGHVAVEPTTLCHIIHVAIMPISEERERLSWQINVIKVVERTSGDHRQKRLTWRWEGPPENTDALKGMPWSKTTGPFSYFTVCMGNQQIGKASCMEFPLLKEDFSGASHEDGKLEVMISGMRFDGSEVFSKPVSLSMDCLQ